MKISIKREGSTGWDIGLGCDRTCRVRALRAGDNVWAGMAHCFDQLTFWMESAQPSIQTTFWRSELQDGMAVVVHILRRWKEHRMRRLKRHGSGQINGDGVHIFEPGQAGQ